VQHVVDPVSELIGPAKGRSDDASVGAGGLDADVPVRARPDEEAHLDPALAAERDHGADLVVGLQHDAAALTDPVDRYCVRVRLGHDRLHDARPFARRDLDSILPAVGKPLARCRQVMRIALRQVEPSENVTCGLH